MKNIYSDLVDGLFYFFEVQNDPQQRIRSVVLSSAVSYCVSQNTTFQPTFGFPFGGFFRNSQ